MERVAVRPDAYVPCASRLLNHRQLAQMTTGLWSWLDESSRAGQGDRASLRSFLFRFIAPMVAFAWRVSMHTTGSAASRRPENCYCDKSLASRPIQTKSPAAARSSRTIASGSEATFTSWTSRLSPSNTETLISSSDTSDPACSAPNCGPPWLDLCRAGELRQNRARSSCCTISTAGSSTVWPRRRWSSRTGAEVIFPV